jgi:hypothetical protein
MQYRLRTLLIVLALGPALLAWVWFSGGMALGLFLFVALAVGGQVLLYRVLQMRPRPGAKDSS